MFVDLSGQRILVVGGGQVALRKTRVLSRFCDHLTVVAPELCPEFAALEAAGRLICKKRAYTESDLEGVQIVIAATDDEELNRRIAAQCKALGILRNIASDRSLCDFYFPSVIEKDGVVIGIGSGGDPARTKRVREKLETVAF